MSSDPPLYGIPLRAGFRKRNFAPAEKSGTQDEATRFSVLPKLAVSEVALDQVQVEVETALTLRAIFNSSQYGGV
jgi:hypothetical protein